MRVIVIGGTGHIGTYLIPRLISAGYSVVNVSRAQRRPYRDDPSWQYVEQFTLDRSEQESAGAFGHSIRSLRPDAVIDITCYYPESARILAEALRGEVSLFLHCGTIWVHGPGIEVPITEEQPRRPFGDYGCRKAAIEQYLLSEFHDHGFPAAILHPGHLVGPGWAPINPAGNFNPQVFTDLAHGTPVRLPNLGNETVHHVHADDVAQALVCALAHRDAAIGQSFHVVSPAALTLRGFAQTVASWFGREAQLAFLPWEEWKQGVNVRDARVTWDHIAHSPSCSIEKARRLLDYRPRYRSGDAVREALDSLIARGVVTV
jgi:nucleoside-diphosphate-sugar epimerase